MPRELISKYQLTKLSGILREDDRASLMRVRQLSEPALVYLKQILRDDIKNPSEKKKDMIRDFIGVSRS